jgi:hypothetical protein
MLAQAYRWTLDDIKKLSYVQVLMIQHAASFNRKLLDKRLEQARATDTLTPTEDLADTGGKRLSELSSDDLMMLASQSGSRGPKVIKLRKDPADDNPPTSESGE